MKEYTHITSMQGTFSRGAAYDYLSGVSKDISDKKLPSENRFGVQLPFIGQSDLYQYHDAETKLVTRVTGCRDGRHYITFGNPELQRIIEHSVLTFADNPEGAVEQLMTQSILHHRRAKEHIAFLIEVSGIDESGSESVRSLVVKFSASPALTGISAGISAEIAASETDLAGTFRLTELPERNLYAKYIDMIIKRLCDSPEKIMFDEFTVKLEELNEEMSGEI